MANSKISALTSATTPLAGTETLPIVQSSTTKQVSIANVTAGRAVSTLSVASLGPNGIPITLQEITAAPTSATAAYVGVSTSAFPGGSNGDLILIPRTSSAADVRVFVGSGTPTEALVVQGSTKDVRVSVGNLVMATSGKGIDFSATAGSGTSELLADYEEGTWTPVLSRTGANPSLTYTASGGYTKVGRLVTINAAISISAVSSQGTGTAIVQGAPFTPGANYSGIGAVSFNSAFSTDVVTSAGITTDPWIVFHTATNSGSNMAGTYAVGTLYFTITYYV